MPRKCSYGRTKSGRCKKKPGPKKGSRRAPSGSRPCVRGRTKSGHCKKKPGPKRSKSGGRSSAQKKWMAHVKRYARENGVTIREAMSLACQTYPTGCRSRKISDIPAAPALGYAPGLVYNPPAMGGPRSRVSQGNLLGSDLAQVRSRLRPSGISLAQRLENDEAERRLALARLHPRYPGGYAPPAPPLGGLGAGMEGHRYYRHRR